MSGIGASFQGGAAYLAGWFVASCFADILELYVITGLLMAAEGR
jgi:hypothetical protein